ncbi:MAG TPA: hypothetical protein VGE74_27115, partial [Gemmata sp.]
PPRPKGPGGRPGGPRPGMGGWPPKQGPANPVAAIGGNMAAEAGATVGAPKLYRWAAGQSLQTMEKEGALTEEETKKVLKQVSESGPLLELAATGK